MPNFLFFTDDVKFSLPRKSAVGDWLTSIALTENKKVKLMNVVFTSDSKILEINKEFLKHDYYTDIITFHEDSTNIEGEMYISIDRVKENAIAHEVDFLSELHRVMAHGLLHVIGYNDKTKAEIVVMRAKEDFYLNLRNF